MILLHSRPHPVYTQYYATSAGEVFSTKSNKVVGYQNYDKRWVIRVAPYKKVLRSRIVYEAWNNVVMEHRSIQIDHIDGDRTNDAPANLQALHAKDHVVKTFNQPNNRHAVPLKLRQHVAVGVTVTHPDGTRQVFDTLIDAQKALHIGRQALSNMLSTGTPHPKKGWIVTKTVKETDEPQYTLPNEEWKPVCIHGKTIYASSLGRLRLSGGKITRGRVAETGYCIVSMSKNFRGGMDNPNVTPIWNARNLYVHRLVAYAFHGPPRHDAMYVDHKDTNRQNNCPENLEWVSPRENNIRAMGKPVIVTDIHTQQSVQYPCIEMAARAHGCHRNTIGGCIKRGHLLKQQYKIMYR